MTGALRGRWDQACPFPPACPRYCLTNRGQPWYLPACVAASIMNWDNLLPVLRIGDNLPRANSTSALPTDRVGHIFKQTKQKSYCPQVCLESILFWGKNMKIYWPSQLKLATQGFSFYFAPRGFRAVEADCQAWVVRHALVCNFVQQANHCCKFVK